MASVGDGLWRCPRCGAGFVNRNSWHSCGVYTVDAFFEGRPEARALYDRLLAVARKAGEFEVVPQKTRIAFLAKTRWAGVPRAGRDFIILGFGLPRRLRSARVEKVERVLGWHLHYVRLTTPSQIDAEVEAWLRESYEQMGLRRYLASRPPERSRPRR